LFLPVDLHLRLDSQAGTGQLLLGPQGFDGGAHLGTFDSDRGFGIELRAFNLGARSRPTILTCLSTPQSEEQRQDEQQCEERDRHQPQQHRAGARDGVVVHRHPARAEAAVDVFRRGRSC
jgi:hypothetical protein